MLEIIGLMVGVYAIWRMIDRIAGKEVTSAQSVCAMLAIVVMGFMIFAVQEQAGEVRNITSASAFGVP
jgi:hypothetical protein